CRRGRAETRRGARQTVIRKTRLIRTHAAKTAQRESVVVRRGLGHADHVPVGVLHGQGPKVAEQRCVELLQRRRQVLEIRGNLARRGGICFGVFSQRRGNGERFELHDFILVCGRRGGWGGLSR